MLHGNFTARQNLDFFTKLGGKKDASDADYTQVLGRVDCKRMRLTGE